MMKGKALSPAIAIVVGKGKPSADSEAPAEDMDGDDAAWTAFGKALRMASESKDDAAIGRALKDAIEYCMPEKPEEGESDKGEY